tara:strand:+ start:117 stop:482 length:366 start_codon:yes stop_codon:yes gene_type:complete
MTEIIELRNQPELKIILSADGFEIIDVSEPKNTGLYSFEEIKNVELTEERTDKLISTLSWILDFITGGGSIAGNYKNKANLKLDMVNRNLKIWLVDADFQKAQRFAQILNEKKPTHNSTYN